MRILPWRSSKCVRGLANREGVRAEAVFGSRALKQGGWGGKERWRGSNRSQQVHVEQNSECSVSDKSIRGYAVMYPFDFWSKEATGCKMVNTRVLACSGDLHIVDITMLCTVSEDLRSS